MVDTVTEAGYGAEDARIRSKRTVEDCTHWTQIARYRTGSPERDDG